MSGKRMIWLLCAALLLVLTILPALAETDEIVLTFGGDCVLWHPGAMEKEEKHLRHRRCRSGHGVVL